MANVIFIPDKMRVGFQKRDGTFDGKLAYIIYYDNKGTLRKEKSWEGWRHKDIDPIDFLNEPTEGFCLNKKVGGYDTGWNHRNTYCRIYDPRGYEFEINIENLLYILENTNSIKGKGLEGKFVYGMDGKDLILIPCDSPDYKLLKTFNDKVKNGQGFKMKDMVVGGTYLNNKNEEVIYMGRYTDYNYSYRLNSYKETKKYFFYNNSGKWSSFETCSSLSNFIIQSIDETCCLNYSELFDKMEYYESYNPYYSPMDKYVPHTLESFTKYANKSLFNAQNGNWKRDYADLIYYLEDGKESQIMNCTYNNVKQRQYIKLTDKGFLSNIYKTEEVKQRWSYGTRTEYILLEEKYLSIEEFFNLVKPYYKIEYLKDGKERTRYYYE